MFESLDVTNSVVYPAKGICSKQIPEPFVSGVFSYILACMKQSHLFTKTRKEAPKDEVAKNAQLLIRAGYIHKEMAGVYSYLPLGLRVLEKLQQIIREEMNKIGGVELLMSSLQRKEVWERTNRWDDAQVDVWFKSQLAAGGEVGLGWSHEEPIGDMLTNYIASYKNLPIFVYQFQTKLRNELRAKSGVMRGREFIMKDMYSFSVDEAMHDELYAKTIDAYNQVFEHIGIADDTFMTFADGGAFTQFSHEFQTITDAGEDTVYINREKNIAINKEVLTDETLAELGVVRDELTEVTTAEVGNIFNFGEQKAKDLGLYYMNEKEEKIPVWMGSYGIGVSRLMGVVVEKFADDNGIVWPVNVAPFRVHLVQLGDVHSEAETLYKQLTEKGIDVLWDDRDLRPGEKFADSDLIGIPTRVVVSEKTKDGVFETKDRKTGDVQMLTFEELFNTLKS